MTDDDELWRQAAKEIKPLKHRKEIVTKTPPRRRAVIREVPFVDVPLEVRKSSASPLPAKRIKQLKQQKIPVEATLDLHGMTMVRAHEAVRQFIFTASRNDYRCVEIITGIGRSEGTGQLKRLFPLWVADSELKHFILHIEINPISRGGSFLVLLRRHKFRD